MDCHSVGGGATRLQRRGANLAAGFESSVFSAFPALRLERVASFLVFGGKKSASVGMIFRFRVRATFLYIIYVDGRVVTNKLAIFYRDIGKIFSFIIELLQSTYVMFEID